MYALLSMMGLAKRQISLEEMVGVVHYLSQLIVWNPPEAYLLVFTRLLDYVQVGLEVRVVGLDRSKKTTLIPCWPAHGT